MRPQWFVQNFNSSCLPLPHKFLTSCSISRTSPAEAAHIVAVSQLMLNETSASWEIVRKGHNHKSVEEGPKLEPCVVCVVTILGIHLFPPPGFFSDKFFNSLRQRRNDIVPDYDGYKKVLLSRRGSQAQLLRLSRYNLIFILTRGVYWETTLFTDSSCQRRLKLDCCRNDKICRYLYPAFPFPRPSP